MWVKLIDLSELKRRRVSEDVLARMRQDGLTFHRTNWGSHLIAATTADPWPARKWEMTDLSEHAGLTLTRCELFPQETVLDRLGKIGGLNFIYLFVAAVLAFAWYLYRSTH